MVIDTFVFGIRLLLCPTLECSGPAALCQSCILSRKLIKRGQTAAPRFVHDPDN